MSTKRYDCRVALTSGTVGKLILCKIGDTYALYGVMKHNRYAGSADWESLNQILVPETLTRIVGTHKGLPHEGVIIGGTHAVCFGNTLFIKGYSGEFGNLHPEAIKACIPHDMDIRYENAYVIGFKDGMPHLHDWLRIAANRNSTG